MNVIYAPEDWKDMFVSFVICEKGVFTWKQTNKPAKSSSKYFKKFHFAKFKYTDKKAFYDRKSMKHK